MKYSAGFPRSMASAVALVVLLLVCPPAARSAADRTGLDLRNVSIQTTHASFSILTADVDHDENVDIVTNDAPGGHVYVYRGKGDGSFADPIDVGYLGHNLRGLGAADFNRDGRLDLAVGVTHKNIVLVLHGLGDGRFSPPREFAVGVHPFLLTVADLNHDEVPDVAVSCETPGGVDVLLSDGRGGMSHKFFKSGKWSSDVAAADWNEDGKVDLAVTNWGDNDVSLLAGNGDGTFAAPKSFTYEGHPWDHHALYRVLAADLDRDGHLDMLWNDLMKAALYIRYGDGHGAFPRVRSVPAGRGVRHAAVADFDGNGWLDLVSANTASNNLSVMLADGSGGYLPTQYVPTGAYPRTVAVADFNGDGRVDIAAANMNAKEITVLLNIGLTTLSADQDLVMAIKPGAAADLSQLDMLGTLVVDTAGRLIIADEGNHRIARVDPSTGAIETIAGIGRAGFSGDGGPATKAALDRPAAVATAADGSVFFSDHGNHRVRKIDPQGNISTVAGVGKEGFSGDGGPAVQAELAYPFGLAVAPDGTLFIADSGNYRVRRIDSSGIITTIAGTGTPGFSGDGGPALAAEIRAVSSVLVSPDGGVLIAEQQNARIRKVDAKGTISTVVGEGATDALTSPGGIAFAPDGSLVLADSGAYAVRRLAPNGRLTDVVTRAAAEAAAGRAAEGRPWGPYGVAVARDGSVYFTDRNNTCVRKVDSAGVVSVVAGRPDEGDVHLHTVTIEPESLALQGADTLQPPVRLNWDHHFFSGSDDNSARGVTAGADGSVYVAGDVGTGADLHVLQLGADGKAGWTFDIKGPNIDLGSAIVPTPSGDLVVAGSTFEPEPRRRDLILVALSPQGQERWRVTEAEDGDQTPNDVAVDGAGNLIVVGEAKGKFTVWARTLSGQERWRYTGNQGSANSVAVDDNGIAYVAGTEVHSWRVVALDADGAVAWQHGIAGRGTARGIALAPDGSLVVTGSRTPRRITLRTEKLDPSGAVVWEYEAIADVGPVLGSDVAVDPAGNAFVVGEIGTDWLTLTLDANGKRRWHFSHDGGGEFKNRDQPFAVALKPGGELLIAGRVHPLPPKPPSLGQVEWRIASYAVPQ